MVKAIFAIDFDGTIVREVFPGIGAPVPGAIEWLKRAKAEGHTIILYTCREGPTLEPAIQYLRSNGVEFDLVNENPPHLIARYGDCRKITCDFLFDDHSWPPFDSWESAHEILDVLSHLVEYDCTEYRGPLSGLVALHLGRRHIVNEQKDAQAAG